MTNPVIPGSLTPLTPQISLDSGIAAVSANRSIHFDETVRMVEQLNSELPKVHQNAVSAKEDADAAVSAKSATEAAKGQAEGFAASAKASADRAEQAAADVQNPVSKNDKASEDDIESGALDKWVDAQGLKVAVETRQPKGDYATNERAGAIEQQLGSVATKSGPETLSHKMLENAKEVQTNWGTASVINPLTTSNGTIRPATNISFTVGASNSGVDVGKSSIVAITPTAAVTFSANLAVKWPGTGAPPTLAANRTYILSLANMQVGSAFFWFANIAGPY